MTTITTTATSPVLPPVPLAPARLPLLGHLPQLWRARHRPLPFLLSLAGGESMVQIDIGSMPVVLVNRPELVHEVLVAKSAAFEKGKFFVRLRPLVGNGLATAPTEVHRRDRRLMQPAFHKARIAGYADAMSRRSMELVESWQDGQVIAVDEVMAEHSVRTLAETMFPSSEIGQPAIAAVRRDIPVVVKNMLLRAVLPKFLDPLPIAPNRAFDAAAVRLNQVIDEVIAAARRTGDTDQPDLLSILLAARDADTGESLSDLEVRDQLGTILFAGTESTASTLSWAFHEIAHHPEVEERLLAEIDAVVGTGPVTFESIPKLDYTRRVLEETLRLHGVTLLMRRAVKPVELGGYLIPEGREVAFSLYALQRDEKTYPDPERFDPDRWLPEQRAKVPRDTYLAYGAGARKCIGDTFAQTSMAITLATVLARWRLRPQAGHTTGEVFATMPHPDHLPMTVEARHR